MRQSRYVWILGLSLLCLITIVTFKTPQTVVSALADSHIEKSPRSTIQHFWALMDLRQTELARNMLSVPVGSLDEQEFSAWETRLNNDPLLSLQKVEFMNLNSDSEFNLASQAIVVRVYWTSTVQDAANVTYSIKLRETEKGLVIESIKRLNNLT